MKRMSIRRLIQLLTVLCATVIVALQFTYFSQLLKLSRDDARENAERTAQQIQVSLERRFESFTAIARDLSRSVSVQNFLTAGEPYRRYSLYLDVHQSILPSWSSSEEVSSICLFDRNGTLSVYNNLLFGARPTAEHIGIADELGQLQTGITFFPSETADHHKLLACCAPIIGSQTNRYLGQRLGTVVLALDLAELDAFLPQDVHGGGICIENESFGFSYPELAPLPKGEGDVLDTVKPINGTGWQIRYRLIETARREYFLPLFFSVFSIIVVSCLMVAVYGIVVRGRIVQPIVRLQQELKTLHQNDDLRTMLSGEYIGEFHDISDSINEMLRNMYDLTGRIVRAQQMSYEMELREQQATLYALEMQVNPHFLFNTLQTLAGIAAAHNETEIVSVCLSLSRILRYALSREQPGENRPGITVRDEIDIAIEYMKICEIRFLGKFAWSTETDERALQTPCLKMLLQPLIENAVKHGLENTYRSGSIKVTARRENGCTIVEVHDNGVGIPPQKYEELLRMLSSPDLFDSGDLKSGHIGISNVHHRIKMTYGPEYGVTLLYSSENGTGVRITLPSGEKAQDPNRKADGNASVLQK